MSGSNYGTRRAVNELTAIFAGQWANGMLPQIRFTPGVQGYRPDADDWGVTPAISGLAAARTSGITQPPIVGLCAAEVWRKIGAQAQAAHRGAFLAIAAGLERYHAWLQRERDPAGEDLLLCLHPWETGTDNSPAFDPLIEATRAYVEAQGLPVASFGRADTVLVAAAHRPTARDYYAYFGLLALYQRHGYDQGAIIAESPFLLQDVLFNSLFVASLAGLADLEDALAAGGPSGAPLAAHAAANRARAAAVSAAIRRRLWDPAAGLFYSYDRRGQILLRTPTVSSFLPLLAGIADAAQAERLRAALRDPAAFWTSTPIPSTAANSPAFDPQRYWSGPSWPVTNWLVWRGLRERGCPEAADLRQATLQMIAEGAAPARVRPGAARVMEQNSVGETFTTPSTGQYRHAWLWDSAIVACSWPLVRTRPRDGAIRDTGFWEYYDPRTGVPLGAAPMTWTASLFLEMLERSA